MKKLLTVLALGFVAFANSGCLLLAAAGGGVLVADEFDEAKECGDDFDPLEDVRGREDGCN